MPEGEEFYNPYRLLRQPGDQPDRRYTPDLSILKGYVGRLECVLEVHTPLEINFKQNMHFNREPRIPGSSLKGVIRSTLEFVGRGCLSVRNNTRNECKWQLCSDRNVCPACDMFGRVAKDTVNKGKVLMGEGVPSERGYGRHGMINLYQGSPKEEHDAFYPRTNRTDSYRKFYHHNPKAAGGIRPRGVTKHSSDLYPVEAGSEFVFSVTFAGLDKKQLALLCYSLALEPGLLHKMGRGKGHGLGSVKIKIQKVFVQEAGDRYRGKSVSNILPPPVEKELEALKRTPELNSFRKMLSWDAAEKLETIRYPGYGWFKDNSQIRLRSIDEIIPSMPEHPSDPILPKIKGSTHSGGSRSVSIKNPCPEGFPENLWNEANGRQQSLIKSIFAIKNLKSDSPPFIEKWKKAVEEGDEKTEKVIEEAFRCKCKAEKDYKKWFKEKFGKELYRKDVSSDSKQKAEKSISPMEGAVAYLNSLDSAKMIKKKIPKKYFKSDSPLTEEEKKDFAQMVKKLCQELGGLEYLEKMKDMLPYLS